MVYAPIWKDTYYTANTQTLSYQIVLDDNVIYSGKAVKRPDADYISININKVCRNYLETDIRGLLEGDPIAHHRNGVREFILKNSAGTTLETYWFVFCYEYGFEPTLNVNNIMSVSVNGHYVDGQLKLVTTFSQGMYGASFSTRDAYASTDYNTLVKCGDVLYYLNARGGWDAFVFEGNTIRTDKITTYNTDQVFNNTTLDFENNRYISEIKEAYALNTCYLTDEQSARFAKHLVGSNKCYLHKMDEGWIKPVVITDTSVTHQTYATNGRKLSQYRVNVELSQTKLRK